MIDDNFLNTLGLGSVNDEEKAKMKAHIEQILQERVGARVEQQLDEAKQAELEQLNSSGNPAAVTAWLQANLPNYQQIVTEETSNIIDQIKPQVAGIVEKYSTAS